MAQNVRWEEYYRDEKDAVFLYRALAEVERDETRRNLFARLAAVEDRHVDRWVELFAEHDQAAPPYHPSRRARLLAWVARRAGPSAVLPLILAEEGREVAAYLELAQSTPHGSMHTAVFGIAAGSAEHARELAQILGRETEPWQVAAGAGGYLRSIVYGFNDGLTANFGLVAGVIGASVESHIVIIAGVAGAIADALSMGASGYLAAKSEAEVQAHQIEMERREIEVMPDIEEEELALIYEAKGLTRERARVTARAMMQDPTRALDTKKREELNPHSDPPVLGDLSQLGYLGVADREHAGALRRRCGALPLHRSRHVGERARHVPGRIWRGDGGLPHRAAYHAVPLVIVLRWSSSHPSQGPGELESRRRVFH